MSRDSKRHGSGKLMKKRYEDALNNQSDSGNKIRALSALIVNFAASVQQYAQVAAIFFGVYLIVEGTILKAHQSVLLFLVDGQWLRFRNLPIRCLELRRNRRLWT